jgi:hypothetical protein
MAIGKINFEIVAPSHTALVIKNYELDFAGASMPASLDPRNTSSTLPRLIDGEWMKFNAAGTKLTRGNADASGVSAGAATPLSQALVFPIWAPVGDYSVQASGVMPVIMIGTFEAWTQMYRYSGTAATPLTGFAVGDRVCVANGAPESGASAKHSVLIQKTSATQENQIAATGMTVGIVLGKDNTRGLHIYAQAGGMGVWF